MFWSGKEVNKEFESVLEEVVFSGNFVLDIGCGKQKTHPRLLGVDAYENYPTVNVQAYMWDLPFEDDSIDGILCISALEHVSKFQVMPTLFEFERVLKPGSKVIILVPDLEYVCQRFLENPTLNWEMDLIFGHQAAEGETLHEGQFHKTGFTKDIFKQYLGIIPSLHLIKTYKVEAYKQINYGFVCQKVKE